MYVFLLKNYYAVKRRTVVISLLLRAMAMGPRHLEITSTVRRHDEMRGLSSRGRFSEDTEPLRGSWPCKSALQELDNVTLFAQKQTVGFSATKNQIPSHRKWKLTRMAKKLAPITEQYQRFVRELKESF